MMPRSYLFEVVVLTIVAFALLAFAPSVALAENIETEHTGGATYGGEEFGQALEIEITGEPLLVDEDIKFRITNDDTDEHVDIEPDVQSPLAVQRIQFPIFHEENNEIPDRTLPITTEQDEFTDIEFEASDQEVPADGVFNRYSVEIVDGEETLGSTDSRLIGVGYYGLPEEIEDPYGESGLNITEQDDQKELTIPRDNEVDESWYVAFTLGEHSDPEIVKPVENEAENDEFNIVLDTSDVDPGVYSWSLEIYTSEEHFRQGSVWDRSELIISIFGVGDNDSSSTDGQDGEIFQAFADESSTGSIAIFIILTTSLLVGYVGYKRVRQSDAEPETPAEGDAHITSTKEEPQSEGEIDIESYSDIAIQDELGRTGSAHIKSGSIDGTSIWVLCYKNEGNETVQKDQLGWFVETVESWEKLDPHPNLLNVHATGETPLPWAAIEAADYPLCAEHTDEFSTKEVLRLVQKICEALHHTRRYGIQYESLTTESVLLADESTIKLRGAVDQFEDTNLRYSAPEEFEDNLTEQSLVYRTALITYELLTGTLPYPESSNNIEETVRTADLVPPSDHVEHLPKGVDEVLLKALSKSPDDRHETVLHLQDEVRTIAADNQ